MNDFQLKHLRRVLNENWRRLPESVESRRQDRDRGQVVGEGRGEARGHGRGAEMTIGTETFSLPYHVCLSELIYGEPLYRQRRVDVGAAVARHARQAAPADARRARAGRPRVRRGRPDAARSDR
jgi:hypothetical protein